MVLELLPLRICLIRRVRNIVNLTKITSIIGLGRTVVTSGEHGITYKSSDQANVECYQDID